MMHAALLDTHVWIWLLANKRDRFGATALNTLEAAAATQAMAVSEISLWEVATKAAKGRLELAPDPQRWLQRAAKSPGIGIISVDRDVLVQSAMLDLDHGDPADRMLIATALKYELRLATADAVILEYAERNPKLDVLDIRT